MAEIGIIRADDLIKGIKLQVDYAKPNKPSEAELLRQATTKLQCKECIHMLAAWLDFYTFLEMASACLQASCPINSQIQDTNPLADLR